MELKDYEVMAGYEEPEPAPVREAPAPAARPAPEEAPAPEDTIDRDINAMSQKYFKDLDSTSGLHQQDRLRLEQGFLANLGAVKEQRAKLENEKQVSLINGLRAQEMEGSIKENRMKMAQAQNISMRQQELAGQVQSVMFDPSLNGDQKRDYVNGLRIQNAAFVSSDPTAKSIFDSTVDMLPKPKYPEEMSDTLKIQVGEAYANAKDEDEKASILTLSKDPMALGSFLQVQKNRKALADKDEETRETNRKELRSSVVKLATDLPQFMDEKEREEKGVSMDDKNPYLTEKSQTNLKTLIGVTRGAKGLEEYESLDDRGRYEMGMKVSIEALKGQIEAQENPDKQRVEETVNKLVPGKRK